jgi:hypothetical protein
MFYIFHTSETNNLCFAHPFSVSSHMTQLACSTDAEAQYLHGMQTCKSILQLIIIIPG